MKQLILLFLYISMVYSGDLYIGSIDNRLECNSTTYNTNGTFEVTIINGTPNETINATIDVIVFYDSDRNGIYNSTKDKIIDKRENVVVNLEFAQNMVIDFNITNKTSPYRDAPVFAYIDYTGDTNLNNNVSSSNSKFGDVIDDPARCQ